jgi:DNA-binding GntR family transcriptional regulator
VDNSHPLHAQPASPLAAAAPHQAEVLADRMTAALDHREPGCRLPRRSALARKYDVGLDEIDAAIESLARRALIRRLPDGQLYRASPAEQWIPVEGADGLGTRLDPMGNAISQQTRQVSRRAAPQDVAVALGLPAGTPVRVVRCVWSDADEPVASSTAYRPDVAADSDPGPDRELEFPPFAAALSTLPAAAVNVELSPSQPAVARTLRLAPGQPVITVTVRFDNVAARVPAGLTVVVLKPELFRVTIETTRA